MKPRICCQLESAIEQNLGITLLSLYRKLYVFFPRSFPENDYCFEKYNNDFVELRPGTPYVLLYYCDGLFYLRALVTLNLVKDKGSPLRPILNINK